MSAARIHTAFTKVSLILFAAAFLLAADSAGARSIRVDKKAPTTPMNVRVSSATSSSISLAWDPAHDKFGVEGYGVYVNGSLVARSGESRATISGLTCGRAYTVGVDAYDAAGNHSRQAWATVATSACLDREAPTAPVGFRQQAATQSEVVLAWDPSSDNIGVVGYGVYRNGLLRTSTAAPTVTLSGFICGSVYEVAVDAVDAAGNRSDQRSTWVKTAACSDTEAPEKPILSLGPATQTSLVLIWQPGVDNIGVDHYNVFLNGARVAQTSELTWRYTGLACATAYSLGLEVADAAGNKSPLVQTAARTSACDASPRAADTSAPSQPGSLAVSAATNTSVTLAWSASTDNVAVAGYGVYVNGAHVQTRPQPGATVSGLVCGTAYTLAVDAYDSAGNRSPKASLLATTAPCADTQSPTTPANVAVTSRTATSIALAWSASSDDLGVVGYGLYRGADLVGTTAVTTGIFSNLACGSTFTLAVDSYDAAGNRSGRATVAASTTACPDATPPSVPTGLSVSNVTGTSLTLGWNASTDNVGVVGYDVYRNGAKIASVSGTSSNQTGLTCGTSYAFSVVAYDAAGNRSSQSQLTATTSACAAPPPRTTAGECDNTARAGYTLVHCDSFDGTALNRVVWDVYGDAAGGCAGIGTGWDMGNWLRVQRATKVENGLLVTTATPASQSACGHIESGGVSFVQGWMYGRYETRIRVEHDASFVTSGVSILWNATQTWCDGEADYYETGTSNAVKSFLHYQQVANSDCGTPNHQHVYCPHVNADGTMSDRRVFHDMVLEWGPTFWRVYNDGRLVCNIGPTSGVNGIDPIPRDVQRLTIQLDIFGAVLGGPVRMETAYARLYRVA